MVRSFRQKQQAAKDAESNIHVSAADASTTGKTNGTVVASNDNDQVHSENPETANPTTAVHSVLAERRQQTKAKPLVPGFTGVCAMDAQPPQNGQTGASIAQRVRQAETYRVRLQDPTSSTTGKILFTFLSIDKVVRRSIVQETQGVSYSEMLTLRTPDDISMVGLGAGRT